MADDEKPKRARPTKRQLHIAITVGVVLSGLFAYLGFEFLGLILAMPANVAWVWEAEIIEDVV